MRFERVLKDASLVLDAEVVSFVPAHNTLFVIIRAARYRHI